LETQRFRRRNSLVTVSLDRGESFKRDVTLDLRAYKGLSVEPTTALVKASERSEVTLRVTAAKDATSATTRCM